MIGLVGESHYQAAIANTYVGSTVRVCHEAGNPFDELALRVETGQGEVIGYIPKSSWLRRAIFDEGRGCAATVREITGTDKASLGVVINITLTDDPIFERKYAAESRETTPPAAGGLGAFVRGLLSGLR
jgi:hypothetical protein